MLRTAALILVVFALSPVKSAAQIRPSGSGEFRTGGVFYENFFQVATDGSRRDIWAGLMEIRFEDPLADDNRLRTYLHVEFLQFQDIGSSPGAIIGVKRRGKSHSFDMSGGLQWNRPRSDVGDELERADILGGEASYTYRMIAGLHLISQAEYREEFLKPERITGSRFYELGGAIRYRAFRGRFSPEVGLMRGMRDTSNARNEYLQETAYAELRTSAVPRVSLRARYQQRRREYTIREIASKNFGREDQRQQTSANLDISLARNLIWNVSGGVEKGESTRAGRSFAARSFGTGFTVIY